MRNEIFTVPLPLNTYLRIFQKVLEAFFYFLLLVDNTASNTCGTLCERECKGKEVSHCEL